jgi:hypothetical protein
VRLLHTHRRVSARDVVKKISRDSGVGVRSSDVVRLHRIVRAARLTQDFWISISEPRRRRKSADSASSH